MDTVAIRLLLFVLFVAGIQSKDGTEYHWPPDSKCGIDSSHFDRKCYLISRDKFDQIAAVKWCKFQMANSTSVHSKEENMFIR